MKEAPSGSIPLYKKSFLEPCQSLNLAYLLLTELANYHKENTIPKT